MILAAIGEKSLTAERQLIEHAYACIALRFGRRDLG